MGEERYDELMDEKDGGKENKFNAQGKFPTLSDWTIEQEMVVQFERPERQGN